MTTRPIYAVRAYHGWDDHDPLLTRHFTLSDALDAARALPAADYPLVDVTRHRGGVVASRRLVGHPVDPDFTPTDTLGGLT